MAFATVSPINHGLGAVNFGGIYKLSTGKIILFISGDTEVYEMADVDTPAVSIFTASFPLRDGAAGKEFVGGGDRVVIAGYEKFVYIEYPGPTVVEDDLPVSFVGVDSVMVAFGGDGNYFYVLGALYPDLFAAYVHPEDPTSYITAEWTALVTKFDELWEFPGEPVLVNSWPQAAGIDDYDASNYASWTAGGFFQTLDYTGIVTQSRPITCYHRGNVASKKIAALTGGWVFTDLGGEQQPFSLPAIAVFWDFINSQYLAWEEDPGGESIMYSADGVTWNSATASNLPDGAIAPNRNYFASSDANVFLTHRLTPNIASTPNTRWWRSPDGQTWTTMDVSAPGQIVGVYSDAGAGPSKVIKVWTTTGDVESSTDEGDTFPTLLVAAIPVADAARLRWVQETPTGLIAWGPDGPIYSQVAADLDTVAWIDEGWPGGTIGSNLRVLDDGEIRVHRNYVGAEVTSHYEIWRKPFGGSWARVVNPKYQGCLDLGQSWRDITAGSSSGYVMTAIGFNPEEQVMLEKFSSVISLDNPSWIQDIDPAAMVLSTGPRQLLVLGQDSRFKYVSQFNLSFFSARHVGWNDAVDQFRNDGGGEVLVTNMFADGDVLCAVGVFAGWLATSDNGNEWLPVFFNTDLRDGHKVLVP